MARTRTAQAYHAGYNAGRAEDVLACYAPDATLEEVASGRAHQGHAALREGLERFFAVFGALTFTPGPHIRAGDSLLCPYRMTAIVRRDLGPLRLDGRRIALSGAHLLEFRAAQILRCRDFWDFDELAAQAA